MKTEQPQAALQVDRISAGFHSRSGWLPVIQDLSLTVEPGQFVSIVGPSGSGKSTLFHMIGGLMTPQEGRIFMNGAEVTGERGHISYMPQQPALFPWLTTLDNVLMGQDNAPTQRNQDRAKSRAESRAEARRQLTEIGLEAFADAYPHMLSGGMQQRAAFLRALLSPQELMLLDEPFSALDAMTRSDMQSWLLHVWERHRRSVLFITHNIEEALLLSDRVYVLSARPATVLRVVDVPFARPRREEIMQQVEFTQLKQELTLSMKEERQKSVQLAQGGF
ncbi:ABC transporter ATP-binding protein [Paenibacillus massiliensis]|uniref:ABC transporter ATP-binding protein n=1 Tax=Paenibacillus massiliensis TaxID=225917 RepID=UPI000378DD2F|nr:ABC transporter ATP-binding protein [Paenibacillus massiliensis]